MFRLIEITRIADTESQAILDFESEVEASGELHSKLGAAMKAETYQAELLILLDNIGKIVESGSHFKTYEVEEEVETVCIKPKAD